MKLSRQPPSLAVSRIAPGVLRVLPIVLLFGVATISFPIKWIVLTVFAAVAAKWIIDGMIGLLMILTGIVLGLLGSTLHLLAIMIERGENLFHAGCRRHGKSQTSVTASSP